MTLRLAEPLPECALCETPTKRETFEANGGLCSSCTREAAGMVLFQTPRSLRNPFQGGGDQ